jgi:hypothetical protein
MKYLLGVFFSSFLLFSAVNISSASEGTFELRSTDSNKYKCFAASLQMQNLNYKIIISCRNIVFPIDETIYSYILWANPKDGGDIFKIGTIGLGRGEYALKPAFTSLFVTAEQNPSVKIPTGKVVMKGSIKPITFLEKEVTISEEEEGAETGDAKTPTSTPETQKVSVRDRLLTGLKRAGLASGLALIAILGLVFVLTRPR